MKALSKEQVLKLVDCYNSEDPKYTWPEMMEVVGCTRSTLGRYIDKLKNNIPIPQLEDVDTGKKVVKQKKENIDTVSKFDKFDETVTQVVKTMQNVEDDQNNVHAEIERKTDVGVHIDDNNNRSGNTEVKREVEAPVVIDDSPKTHNNPTNSDNGIANAVEHEINNDGVKTDNSQKNDIPKKDLKKQIYDIVEKDDVALAIFAESRRYGYLDFPQFIIEQLLPWWDIKIKLEEYWDYQFTPKEFIQMLKGMFMQLDEYSNSHKQLTETKENLSELSSKYQTLQAAFAATMGGIKVAP